MCIKSTQWHNSLVISVMVLEHTHTKQNKCLMQTRFFRISLWF